MNSKLKQYYVLAKPGIIRGNVMVAGAAFLYASAGSINFVAFITVLLGTSLVVGSSCTFNNLHDRKMDSKMDRTKNRALVTGDISIVSAVIYGLVLAILGFSILIIYTNLLTAAIGLVGMFFYVAIYTPAKPRTYHAALLGSISGAVPPLSGYVAVTNRLDASAFMLFLIMLIWQMPHFYAIAVYRSKEYAAANVPVLSVVKNKKESQLQIILYIIAFAVATIAFYRIGNMSLSYIVIMFALDIFWLKIAFDGFGAEDSDKWAKKIFGVSLLILLVFSALISIDNYLP